MNIRAQATEEYETGLIGNTLICYEAAKVYQSILTNSDFQNNELAIFWDLFKESDSREDYFNACLMNAKKRGLGVIVSRLMDGFNVSQSYLQMNVERIKQASVARRTRQRLADLMSADDAELPGDLDKLAAEVKAQAVSGLDNYHQQLADEFIKGLDKTDTSDRIKTGFETLDRFTHGLNLGNISVIGAFPSAGKTALALNIAGQATKDGKRVMFFSQEMTSVQLLQRYSCAELNLSYGRMMARSLEEEAKKNAGRLAVKMANEKRVWLFDNFRYIEQQADMIIRLKPQFAIVDFLQAVRTKERLSNKADLLEYLVDEYKRIALSSNCHILILSQHNRGASQDAGKATMFNLKGSSGIEAGGDYIAILDRPNVYNKKEPPEKAELKLVKNKFGMLGEVDLYFDGDRQRFRELLKGEAWTVPVADEEKPF